MALASDITNQASKGTKNILYQYDSLGSKKVENSNMVKEAIINAIKNSPINKSKTVIATIPIEFNETRAFKDLKTGNFRSGLATLDLGVHGASIPFYAFRLHDDTYLVRGIVTDRYDFKKEQDTYSSLGNMINGIGVHMQEMRIVTNSRVQIDFRFDPLSIE